MAVERVYFDDEDEAPFEALSVEIADETPANQIEEEGGGLTVLLGEDEPEPVALDTEFDANLAEQLSDQTLRTLSADLIQKFDDDILSREEWEQRYVEGIRLLGITPENKTTPWPGASGVFHPVMAETTVAFEANAAMELCPASGPAKTKIVGEETAEKLKLAKRVQTELNYQMYEKMPEWRTEMEQLLFRLPLSGLCVKKVYFDPLRKRPVSKTVPAGDFVVQYGASELETCPRYAHREYVFESNLRALIDAGFYRDVEINSTPPETTDILDAESDEIGIQPSYTSDDRHELIEFYADLVFEDLADRGDLAAPYIVTIERRSGEVLSVRRNWKEEDPEFRKLQHFVPYNYIPGFGFYGFGLIHLVGGATEAATALLRQLIDAGTLSNVPSGFKANTFRVKGDDTPVMPGEFRDVDIASGTIKDSLLPLPYKEPSAVLFALLQNVVEEARRVASVADMKIGDQSAQTPVGTTLALLERSLRVMSAVHARLHYSLKQELALIAGLIRDKMGAEYEYDKELGFDRRQDFAGPVDVVPVSDPNTATQAQRVIVYQAAINIAATAPQVYDQPRLHRGMLDVLGIKDADKIVPLPEDLQPTNPVSENMAILMGKPTKAFIQQDHEAHIRVHMAALQDPKLLSIVGQSPQAQTIQAAAHAHIQEHVAYAYRREIEKKLGVPLPAPNEPLDDDTEALIARLAAQASEQLVADHVAEAQMAEAQRVMQDPVTQLEIMDIEQRDKDSQRDHKAELMKISQRDRELQDKRNLEQQKIDIKRQEVNARVDGERKKTASQAMQAGVKLSMQARKDRQDADNKTEANRIAAAKAKSDSQKKAKAKPQ